VRRWLVIAVLLPFAAGTVTPAALAAGSQSALNPPAANNPLSPGLPASPAQTPTSTSPAPAVVSTTSSSSSTGIGGGTALAIVLGAVLLIGGIAFFIWRDARRRAPAHAADGAAAAGRSKPGSKAKPKPRKLSPAERRRRKRGRAR
jgi:hypothetical protein